jgi:hypothetical protein
MANVFENFQTIVPDEAWAPFKRVMLKIAAGFGVSIVSAYLLFGPAIAVFILVGGLPVFGMITFAVAYTSPRWATEGNPFE